MNIYLGIPIYALVAALAVILAVIAFAIYIFLLKRRVAVYSQEFDVGDSQLLILTRETKSYNQRKLVFFYMFPLEISQKSVYNQRKLVFFHMFPLIIAS